MRKAQRPGSVSVDFLLLQFPDQPINAVTEAWTAQSLTVYVLERRSAVAMGKAVLGPEDPAVARSSAPHRYARITSSIVLYGTSLCHRRKLLCSIRAKYGISATRNAVYSSRNLDEANRDISFFFPQAQGNVGIETEHRLMDFDVSDLYPEVPLSSMSWLNPHERGQVETMEDSIMHTETDEDILTEPALALRMLTDEYIQGLSESVRHAVQERIQILDEAADAGGNSGSCSHSTTHEANNEFLSFLSPHLEM